MNCAAIISAKTVHGRRGSSGGAGVWWGCARVDGVRGRDMAPPRGWVVCRPPRSPPRRSLTPVKSPGLVSWTCPAGSVRSASCWPDGTRNARAIAALLDAARAGQRRGAGGPRGRRVRQVDAAGRRGGRRRPTCGAAHLRGGVGVPAGVRRAAAAAVAAARPDRGPAGAAADRAAARRWVRPRARATGSWPSSAR